MQAGPASIGRCSGLMPRVIAEFLFVVSGVCVFACRFIVHVFIGLQPRPSCLQQSYLFYSGGFVLG